jgi:preprotein translocase subunit Sec63
MLRFFFLARDNIACRLVTQLLGNNLETNNEAISAARQQICNKQQLNSNRGTVFSLRPVITGTGWGNELSCNSQF